jgi:predicted nucleic acid-binding protein
LRDEDAAYANAVLAQIERDGFAIVPPPFWDELLNVFVIAERRGRIESEFTDRFLHEIASSVPLRTIQPSDRSALLGVARRYALTAHDACYLSLAIETQSSLATLDAELRRAAAPAGVSIFGPSA